MVLIVIDGLDASGKSTQATMLRNFILKKGRSVLLRVHPSDDNFLGVKTRQFLQQKGIGPHIAAALFYMLDVMRSIFLYSWQRYDYVIFVRYLMGTAYLPSPLHKIAYYFFALWVPQSPFMFFLDVNPQDAYQRILRSRQRLEMFENPEELEKVRQRALTLAVIGHWKILNAKAEVWSLQEKIRKILLI